MIRSAWPAVYHAATNANIEKWANGELPPPADINSPAIPCNSTLRPYYYIRPPQVEWQTKFHVPQHLELAIFLPGEMGKKDETATTDV